MLRQSAVDMENSEPFLDKSDGYTIFYKSRKDCALLTCILILSHGLSFGIGYNLGNILTNEYNCGGSESMF